LTTGMSPDKIHSSQTKHQHEGNSMGMTVCEDCGCEFDYLETILGDYTELVGTMLDGCILSECPSCKEEVVIPQ